MNLRVPPAVVVGAFLTTGCNKDDTVLLPFNAEDDVVKVHVGPEPIEQDPSCDEGLACTELHSYVEGAVIGTSTVEPAWGPVGTTHRLLAVIGDEWEDRIDRVTVAVDGQRGEAEYELDRDRANPGAWGLSLESHGTPDEVRVDRWTILLWEAVPKDEVDASGGTP